MKKILQSRAGRFLDFFYVVILAFSAAFLFNNAVSYAVIKPSLPYSKKLESNLGRREGFSLNTSNFLGLEKSDNLVNLSEKTAPAAINFSGKLTGVLVGESLADSRAILVIGQEIYVVNSSFEQGGMILLGISHQGASIKKGDNLYELILDDGLPNISTHTNNLIRPVFQSPTNGGIISGNNTSSGTETVSVSRGEILTQLKDINSVLRGIHIAPLYIDDKFTGWRIASLADSSPVRILGFQKNDIINRINGEELLSPDVLFSMLAKIDDISVVSIDITRDNQKKTLFVEIQ